jgi:uncharacterized Zn-finger protein
MRSTHLLAHEKSHSNVKDFACSFESCTAAFTTRQHLIRHEKVHTSPMIPCDFPGCTAEFSKRFQLRWHKASHEKGIHVCETCSSTFDSLPALEKHRDRVHDSKFALVTLQRKRELTQTKKKKKKTRSCVIQLPCMLTIV